MVKEKQTNAQDAAEPSFEPSFERDAVAPRVSLADLISSGVQTSTLRSFDKNSDASQLFGNVELIDASKRAHENFAQRQAIQSSIQLGKDDLISQTTDAKGRTRSFEYNDNRELVKVTMENNETWTRARKDGDVWVWRSDKASPDRRLLNQQVMNDGTLFVETSAQNRVYFHQDGSKEIVDYKEMLAASQAINAATIGFGTDEAAIFGGLEGRTAAQLECIQDIYEKQFDATVSGDIHDEMSGSDLIRATSLLHGPPDRVSEIHSALQELGLSLWTAKSDNTLEAVIRNTLRTMSHDDLEKADAKLTEDLDITLRQLIRSDLNISEQTKEVAEILLKGFDKLTDEDHRDLVKIALESRDSSLFQEAMRFAPEDIRNYYGLGDGKEKVQEAFGAKWYENVASFVLLAGAPIAGIVFDSQIRQREQHAKDYAEQGKLKLSTQIYENSSLLGDNEAAIENLLANLSDRERQQYRIERWLAEGAVDSLPASDKAAFEKYSKSDLEKAHSFYSETSNALKHVAGQWFDYSAMKSEFMNWEANITTPGGGLIAMITSHNKLIDSDIDDVLLDIENMSEGEWSRLKSEQGYRERVKSALGTFLSNSELSRASTILDEKLRCNSYADSKQERRGILDMVVDNVGYTVDETEIYDALQNVTHEDVVALQKNGGANELADFLRIVFALDLSSDEQHAAEGLLNGIIENGESKKTIIDTLNIHAADKNTDERQVVKDIEKAFRDDPQLRNKILNFDSKFSKEFVAAAKHAVGPIDYNTYVKPLIANGDLKFDVRMSLNSCVFNDDENNAFEDAATFGKSLDNLGMERRLKMADNKTFQETNFSYLNEEERKIAINAFVQAEMRPEDKIRAAVLGAGTDEDAVKSVLNEVRRSEKYNGLSQSDFDLRIKADLARMKTEYARKYGEDLPTRLVDELSQRDFQQVQRNLNVRSGEGEFLLAQRRASETRDGFGSRLNDAIWDGTGFQVDEDMRDLVEAMQLQPNQVAQFAQQLHTAVSLHATSKEAMANAIVDATMAAAAVGASFFTGGVSLSLLSATAFAGAVFKVGTKSLVMGADYDFASMGVSDAAGGAFEAATIFLGTNLLKVGGGAGVKAARDALAMGGDDLLREGSEAILKAFENDVEKLIVNSLRQRAQGITKQAIAEIAARYAGPQQAEALAGILTDSIGRSVKEVGSQWLKTTAIKAANSAIDGAIGGGGAGTLAAIGSADSLEEVAERGLVSAGIGSVSAGAASIGFSLAGKALSKSGEEVDNLKNSIAENQALFKEALSLSELMEARKSLYNVQFERVIEPEGRYIATLDNPSVMVKQGDFIATRLNPDGTPNLERGQVNQWSMRAEKIAKTYKTTVDALNQSTGKIVAPTRIDGPTVHMIRAKTGGKIQTKWGAMTYEAGDWLANYDYDKLACKPGNDYDVITDVSRKATYEPAGHYAEAVFDKLAEMNKTAPAGDIGKPIGASDMVMLDTDYDTTAVNENLGVGFTKDQGALEKVSSPELNFRSRAIDATNPNPKGFDGNPESKFQREATKPAPNLTDSEGLHLDREIALSQVTGRLDPVDLTRQNLDWSLSIQRSFSPEDALKVADTIKLFEQQGKVDFETVNEWMAKYLDHWDAVKSIGTTKGTDQPIRETLISLARSYSPKVYPEDPAVRKFYSNWMTLVIINGAS